MSITIETVAQELKVRTEERHKASEALLMPKIAAIAGREDYVAILRMFYGFFAPLEKVLAAKISHHQLPDIDQRMKSARILSDISDCTPAGNFPPLSDRLPPVATTSQAFGAFYVLEGSTLGGRYLCKMLLKEHRQWLTEKSLSFFNGYGEETGPKWKIFQDRLNQEYDRQSIVDTANQTFCLLEEWIKKTLYYDGTNN